MNSPFLQLRNISKEFPGVKALNNVSIDAFRGEVTALVGANGAGKSTLMNILGGVIRKDSGEIFINNEKVEIHNPSDAKLNGIAFVHQELSILPKMSIIDNLLFNSFPQKLGIIESKKAYKLAVSTLQKVGFNLDTHLKIRDVTPGDQQLVEIARVLLSNPSIVIFDEPTSSLSNREKDHLFEQIYKLKKDGAAVIYITHLLEEVFKIADRLVTLRNGESVSQGLIKDYTPETIIKHITGLDCNQFVKKQSKKTSKECVLKVEKLNSQGLIKNISFDLSRGEILGVWGLMGSGRTELIRAIIGLDPIDSGNIFIGTQKGLQCIKPNEAKKWIGIITEDRRKEGLFFSMAVNWNITIANLKELIGKVWPFINKNLENKTTNNYIKRLNIKVSSINQKVETLSGGNQQKIIISRWLQRNPIIYFMDEPFKGIDVGSKVEIKRIIQELASNGAAVLLISSEIDELISICSQYIVLCRGQLTQEFSENVTKEKLIEASTSLNFKESE
ncbi:MAG: sugar ABC transporter ATP-binding protein [Anaerolineaceae bacterium]